MTWYEPILWAVIVVASVPLLVLTVECLAALPRGRETASRFRSPRPPCAVIIPAHNEQAVLGRTLAALTPQLGPGDRVIVVADNCTDGTAEVAHSFGVIAVERTDTNRRGKGYALAFGVDQLRDDPPTVVVILDADCTIASGSLDLLVRKASETGQPAQAAYRMAPPPSAGPEKRVAAFAFTVKNVLRPLGLARLGLPCLLTGTGMAFPWAALRDARLGHGHIVEDMQLAVDLTLTGWPATFVPDSEVNGEFPTSDPATVSQRRRWEHGHLQVLLSGVPRLLVQGLSSGRIGHLALALELSVPPLSFLVVATVALTAILCGVGWATGSWEFAIVFGAVALAAALSLSLTWWRYGRKLLPLRAVFAVPAYVLWKLPIYFGFLTSRQTKWVRTARG